jgi:glycosyltransferase involved in cell wall biosynthesis
MTSIVVNARFCVHRLTGMQRYGLEISRRLGNRVQIVRPARSLRGAAGHLWEQFYLPSAVGKRLLWSPNNTGPLAVSHQICTIHDLIPLDHPEWFSRCFSSWYEWLLPRLVKQVRHIIAISEFTKRRLVERLRVRPERVTVIPNGVEARFHPRGRSETDAVRRELGIPTPAYLLCVGSLEPRKNLGRLLLAWSRIEGTVPEEVSLVVAGARGSARVFQSVALANIPPRVHFTGYVSDDQLPSLYSGALALVYPSLCEGFGLPPLEAMASGVPVVTSCTSSMPEVVGEDAVLVDPEGVESIADGIQRVVSSNALRQELSRRGLERAREITWERTAQQTLQLLLAYAPS